MGHIISLRHQEKRELTIKQLINTTYGSAIRRVEVSQVEKKNGKIEEIAQIGRRELRQKILILRPNKV